MRWRKSNLICRGLKPLLFLRVKIRVKIRVKSFLHPFNAFFCRFFTFEKIAVRVYAICYGICRQTENIFAPYRVRINSANLWLVVLFA